MHTLTEQYPQALEKVDAALQLAPNDRDALMLKSTILMALGREREAGAIKEHAEYLPEGNWTEQLIVK